MREILWDKCFPVCESSACWLYDGANGDLLQEDVCHKASLPGLLQPEPHGRTVLTPASTGDTQTLKDRHPVPSICHKVMGPDAMILVF